MTTSKMPLRKPAVAPTDDARPADQKPDDAPMPGTPRQGGPSDGRRYIPPPPVLPKGLLRCKVSQVNQWKNRDGVVAINTRTGEPSIPVVVFQVTDPKEAALNRQGKPSCFMSEDVRFNLDLGQNADNAKWYSRTVKYLSDMGCGQSTWPKGPVTKDNPHGMCDEDQLCEHIRSATSGKEFLVEVVQNAGKGDKKDQVYVNIKSIKRYVPPAAPARPAAPKPADLVPADSDAIDEGDGEDSPA